MQNERLHIEIKERPQEVNPAEKKRDKTLKNILVKTEGCEVSKNVTITASPEGLMQKRRGVTKKRVMKNKNNGLNIHRLTENHNTLSIFVYCLRLF